MKLHYYPGTDSLYLDLNAKPSADSRDVAEGLVIDLDSAGQVVGIDIQHASQLLDLNTLETESLPAGKTRICLNGVSYFRSGFLRALRASVVKLLRLRPQHLIHGIDVHHSEAAVDGRQHALWRERPPQHRNFVCPGAIGRQIHSSQQRMPSPRA
jgi:uncharacterized protein YuzE